MACGDLVVRFYPSTRAFVNVEDELKGKVISYQRRELTVNSHQLSEKRALLNENLLTENRQLKTEKLLATPSDADIRR